MSPDHRRGGMSRRSLLGLGGLLLFPSAVNAGWVGNLIDKGKVKYDDWFNDEEVSERISLDKEFIEQVRKEREKKLAKIPLYKQDEDFELKLIQGQTVDLNINNFSPTTKYTCIGKQSVFRAIETASTNHKDVTLGKLTVWVEGVGKNDIYSQAENHEFFYRRHLFPQANFVTSPKENIFLTLEQRAYVTNGHLMGKGLCHGWVPTKPFEEHEGAQEIYEASLKLINRVLAKGNFKLGSKEFELGEEFWEFVEHRRKVNEAVWADANLVPFFWDTPYVAEKVFQGAIGLKREAQEINFVTYNPFEADISIDIPQRIQVGSEDSGAGIVTSRGLEDNYLRWDKREMVEEDLTRIRRIGNY